MFRKVTGIIFFLVCKGRLRGVESSAGKQLCSRLVLCMCWVGEHWLFLFWDSGAGLSPSSNTPLYQGKTIFSFSLFKGVGNKPEISVKGQEKLNSSSAQRSEKAVVQNASSPETTSGAAGRKTAVLVWTWALSMKIQISNSAFSHYLRVINIFLFT